MNETTARRWAYSAAAAGIVSNGLFVAFYVSFAIQGFGDPYGVAAGLGSAADYAGIPQNLLLVAVTAVVYRFLSRQQRPDRLLQGLGAVAFAAAAASGVLTVTGVTPGIGPLAIGSVVVSTAWLLAVGIRGAGLPGRRRARAGRAGQAIAAMILCCGALQLFGLAINVAAVVWTALVAGALGWLAIPVWTLAVGRALGTAESPRFVPASTGS